MKFVDATKTSAALWLYLKTDRDFWIASDLKTSAIFGRFNGGWFA